MKTRKEHCGFTLTDVNYEEGYILLESNDHTEEVKFSFEFIQDVNKYITKEWNWQKTKE